jgi:leader peptidase (prepilin peptidase) / N-methyltransferase
MDALLGVLAGGGFLWAVAYLYFALRGREGIGGGDIKLLGWIGAVLGWKAVPIVILVSSLIGSVVGLSLAAVLHFKKDKTKDQIIPKKKEEKSPQSDDEIVLDGEGLSMAIPFGPYLAGAALLYLLFDGPSWSSWYLALHGM